MSNTESCTDRLQHAYVTVEAIALSSSSDLGLAPSDPNFFTVKLEHPQQIDLMAPTDPSLCFAGVLSGKPIKSGTYLQLRLFMLPNEAALSGNQCPANAGNNCVQLADGSFETINLNAFEQQNGIALGPNELAGGAIAIGSSTADLDININACSSLYQDQLDATSYRIRTLARAGLLCANPAISGRVRTGLVYNQQVRAPFGGANPLPGAFVWLEQQSHSAASSSSTNAVTVENLIETTQTDSNGEFSFCPVFPGTYEIVTDLQHALVPNQRAVGPTITTDVNVTCGSPTTGLVIPLVPVECQPVASVEGWYSTTVDNFEDGDGDDVELRVLQPFAHSGSQIQALIPPVAVDPEPPISTTTDDGGHRVGSSCNPRGCPSGTNCACYAAAVPAANPVIGAASLDGSGYAPPQPEPVLYSFDGAAALQGSKIPVCSIPELLTNPLKVPLNGSTIFAPGIRFQGCN